MIRLAELKDLPAIMEVVSASVEVMNGQGNFQWDNTYPLAENFQGDLDKQELYVYEEDEHVLGAVAISEKEHSEYHEISWSSDAPAITTKRLAVHPEARGKGIADAFFRKAEEVSIDKGLRYLKTDTFSKNTYAQKLFARHGYTFVEKRLVPEKEDSLLYYEKKV
ncbi:GNAT family N-acetyltransferase [Radiobacillus kanasensis]|uniref:GNAT family N-acetyltransferase n=1 Tax=Radiobacillus kanasensis TaxID=2844358 RepID=UPI001E3D75DA|nr:GNAT family N-acetyltransferase [Radiobacillus kanasensis]UFT99803.1 GNAT family N-acetyltransferase [Radiobacillus kanasensis]